MSFATFCVSRTPGDGVVVEERRTMSSDCSAMSPPYARSMSTRNALNSGVFTLASPTNGVSVLVM